MDTPETNKHAGGRPTSYKPQYCAHVIELGKQGKSQAQIARDLDVPKSTLNGWGLKHDEFSVALARAKTYEQAYWEDIGEKALFADRFQQQVYSISMRARFKDDYTDPKMGHGDGNTFIVKIEGVDKDL